MKSPYEIIKRPIITERSAEGMADGRYTFEVAKDAKKPEIRKAVEELFEVKVLKVNTMNIPGKKKRVGMNQGYTSNWKKAVVQIDTNPEESKYLGEGGKEVKSDRKYKSSIEDLGFGQ